MADGNQEYAPVPRNAGMALNIPSVPGLTAWCDPQCHPETAPDGFIGPRTAFFGTVNVPLVVLDAFGRGHRHINMGHETHIEGEGTDLDRVLTGFQGPTYPFRAWLREADGEVGFGEGHDFADQLTDQMLEDIGAQIRAICDTVFDAEIAEAAGLNPAAMATADVATTTDWGALMAENPHAAMAIGEPRRVRHPGPDLPSEERYFTSALGPDESGPPRHPRSGKGL